MLLCFQQAGVCAPTCLLRVQREGEWHQSAQFFLDSYGVGPVLPRVGEERSSFKSLVFQKHFFFFFTVDASS